ncbi:MAG TPA: hypothetical protein VEI57_11745 [Nitrospirota bacterium]|nr:hypothetical protein [Nitrospirota bacterium]
MEITEQKLKDILKEQRIEFQQDTNHILGIMKEDIDSKMQLIGEQYGAIKEQVATLTGDMQIVKTDLEFIKSSLRKKVDYDEFSALEKRVAMLEAKVRK